jgi:transposase
MDTITITIGLDIAKSVFQVHGEDKGSGAAIVRRFSRKQVRAFFEGLGQPALVGIEACGSAHYWARELTAMGHSVRLLPPAYVKPFVRRNKTDASDARAIHTAMLQPDMRFVPVKSAAEQAARGLEGARDLLIRQCTQIANALRGHAAEMGLVAAQGERGLADLMERIEAGDPALPPALLLALRKLLEVWREAHAAAAELEAAIFASVKQNPTMRRLTGVPGVGPHTAHAIVAAVGENAGRFRSARDFAAWIGLTPREHQSARKRRHGGISRMGDGRLRRLLVLGASAVGKQARIRPGRASPWLLGVLGRRPVKVATVAQAAKTARILFAMLRSGEPYRARGEAAAA